MSFKNRIISLSVLTIASIATILIPASPVNATSEKSEVNSQKEQNQRITVEPGDYLDRLAQENETTYLRLFYANEEIKHPDLIYPGQVLRVPAADETLEPRTLPNDVVVPVQQSAPTNVSAAPQVAAPATATSSPRPASQPTVTSEAGIWDQLAACESGGNWSINTGNGFYGGLQFTLSSWQAVGGTGYPHLASKSEQIARAQQLQAIQGWGAWPTCSAKLGLL